MNTAKQHWDKIYSNKKEEEQSWFQPYPKTSVAFIDHFKLPTSANIIDIGGGDSRLADALLEKGFKNTWVLDISSRAIERAKTRLGNKASAVHWVVSDVLDFSPTIQFDLWHDRAAFHFLTSPDKVNAYVAVAEKYIKKDGILILGTFSESGPKKCSGLDIKKYSPTTLSSCFEKSFERIRCMEEGHTTPFNTVQDFLFCSFRRK